MGAQPPEPIDAAAPATAPPKRPWHILVVDDVPDSLDAIVDTLETLKFEGAAVIIHPFKRFEEAEEMLREGKIDIAILDVYQGRPGVGRARGVELLKMIKTVGFAPTILYTAAPQGLEDVEGPFSKVVDKSAGGAKQLVAAVEAYFALRIPQLFRALANHASRTLAYYMWEFVHERWGTLRSMADKPEFMRLLVQSLAASLVTDGIEQVTREAYPNAPPGPGAGDRVHPSAFYVIPMKRLHPQLGDLVELAGDGAKMLVAVLQPNCDLEPHPIKGGGKAPDVDHVLCADAIPLAEHKRFAELGFGQKKERKNAVEKLLGSRDRDDLHFLPGVWGVPDLIIDFTRLFHVPYQQVQEGRRVAALASPYAEHLGARFGRYVSRLGPPDLDVEFVLERLYQETQGKMGTRRDVG